MLQMIPEIARLRSQLTRGVVVISAVERSERVLRAKAVSLREGAHRSGRLPHGRLPPELRRALPARLAVRSPSPLYRGMLRERPYFVPTETAPAPALPGRTSSAAPFSQGHQLRALLLQLVRPKHRATTTDKHSDCGLPRRPAKAA